MREAFHVQLHEDSVNGETHYAAANEPLLPAEFADRVLGFRSLHNFRAKSRLLRPKFTDASNGSHSIAPDDFATIYNIHAAYNSGVTGAGQQIAVVGQTDIQLQDIRAFRAASGLPPSDPQVILVPGSTDPGLSTGDIDEAYSDGFPRCASKWQSSSVPCVEPRLPLVRLPGLHGDVRL